MKSDFVNYSQLEKSFEENDKKTYKLADVEHRLVKVAFDVVRFMDGDDVKSLWKIQSTPDGEYIIANYDVPFDLQKSSTSELNKSASSKDDWKIFINEKLAEVQLFYKADPVVKLSASDLGIPSNELDLLKSYLPKKLSENKQFATCILKYASADRQKELFTKYPELS